MAILRPIARKRVWGFQEHAPCGKNWAPYSTSLMLRRRRDVTLKLQLLLRKLSHQLCLSFLSPRGGACVGSSPTRILPWMRKLIKLQGPPRAAGTRCLVCPSLPSRILDTVRKGVPFK